VLLCQRAIAPRRNFWTLPGGFLEYGETTEQAAQREVFEEAGARITIDRFYMMCEQPDVSEVYLIYQGRSLTKDLQPGPEVSCAEWFAPNEIPWNSLAYPLVAEALVMYFEDKVRSSEMPARIASHPKGVVSAVPRRQEVSKSLRRSIRRSHFSHLKEPPDGYW